MSTQLATKNYQQALRGAKILVGCYVLLSVLTLVYAYLFTTEVNSTVWVRGGIVAATSLLLLRFAIGASHGSKGSYRRLRIISAVLLVVFVVILALPGFPLPMWMKIEQGVCAFILLCVVFTANSKQARALFAK